MRRLLVLAAILIALSPLPASAHPHIFIDAKARIVFDSAGLVEGIHNDWTFDEAYSAWAMQGLDANGDGIVTSAELVPLAEDTMSGLGEYEYYTFAGEGPSNLKFVHGSNAVFTNTDGRLSLSFDVALSEPYRIEKALEIAINDPEYYVAITFADLSTVELVNAPANCAASLEDGHTMPDAIADELSAIPADVTKLPPDLEKALRGVQGAILVSCPGGSAPAGTAAPVVTPSEPETALDAANALGEATVPVIVASNDMPFGGPPPEPGLRLPRTGFLGWIGDQERNFYQAMNAALARFKTDWTAFWVLGGLSFLYGVFHAAGPGHGKVVITSYVLANEQQVRRGIFLSFLSAMMQSLVAISFVLIAALVLGMTSMAMSSAANWVGISSYGLIALLGLWLIARKLFGWGHSHAHHDHDDAHEDRQAQVRRQLGMARDAHGRIPGDPHYGHDHGEHDHHDHHDHDDHHGHAHVVTADQVRGSWREQLGVVVGVGLRPCSGALVVLAFALSQGTLAAGIAAVLLMGLGTAITTGTLASIAVYGKGVATRLAGVDNPITGAVVWWAELAGAVIILAFGIVLVLASLP